MEFVSESISKNDNQAIIKIIGVGGGGCNAVNRMIDTGLKGVSFIAADSRRINPTCKAETKIQFGKKTTNGLGAGGKPEIGKIAVEESLDEIIEQIQDADMIIITAGMGGGTGTGAALVIAKAAKEWGALTVAVVTKPFSFEGKKRRNRAAEGIRYLRENVDSLVVIPNDKLIDVSNDLTLLVEAFSMADDVIKKGVHCISGLITEHAMVNVDFADVRTIMEGKGLAYMGIGTGEGDNRIEDAINNTLNSPLLETSIKGAKSVLLFISGGYDMSMDEVNTIAERVHTDADDDANIIFGADVSEDMKDKVSISIIATDFNQSTENKQYEMIE